MENYRQLANAVQKQIESAFPDVKYFGAITAVDGLPNEELDEEQALLDVLFGKSWSEIPDLFIENYPDSFLLLTNEAFMAYIAAWFMRSLENEKVREMLVYSFTPDIHRSTPKRPNQIGQFSLPQRDAFRALLAYCVEVETSEFIKKHARSALEYSLTLM